MLKVKLAIIGLFITAVFLMAAAMPAQPADLDTANFTNDSDAWVLVYVRKSSGKLQTVCVEPNQHESAQSSQTIQDVWFAFMTGSACRHPNTPIEHTYPFYYPETSYIIRGQRGHYSVSVQH